MRQMMGVGIFVLCACSSSDLGSRVEYGIGEIAGTVVAGGLAGSCLQRPSIDYPDSAAMTWALGTTLDVNAWWPDRTDCTGWWNPSCPEVHAELVPLGADAWSVRQIGAGADVSVNATAIGVGQGGFSLRVGGDRFQPDFQLTVEKPAALRIERAGDARYGSVIPGSIDNVEIPAGGDAWVAVTVRDAQGDHLCGPVPAAVEVDGSVVSLDRITTPDFVNLPYHLVAGQTAGAGAVRFTAGDVSAVLTVKVSGTGNAQ